MRSLLVAALAAGAITISACGSQPTPTPTPAAPVSKPVSSPAVSPAVSPAPSPSAIPLAGVLALTANEADRSVSVVDVSAGRVVGTIPLDRPPHRIDVTSDARLAAASDNSSGSREVMLVDVAGGRKLADLSTGNQPDGVALLNRGTELVVANSGEDSLTDIDLNARSVSGTIHVGTRPSGVAVARPTVSGAPAPAPAVSPVPVTSPAPAVSPAASPSARPATQGPAKAFVANSGDGTVSVIDLNTRQVIGTVQVGGRPTRVAVSADGTRAFVLNPDGGRVIVLDASSNQRFNDITVGPDLTDLAPTSDGRFLFVTAADAARNLYKIDLAAGQVVQSFSALRGGANAAASPVPAVSPAASPAAAVASPSPAATGPGALAVAAGPDPARVFVTTSEDQLVVWDVSGNRAAASVPVGKNPVDVAVGVATTAATAPSPAASPAPAIKPAASPSPSVVTP